MPNGVMVNQSKLDLQFKFKKMNDRILYAAEKQLSNTGNKLDQHSSRYLDRNHNRYILNLVSRQVTGVIIKSEKIRATLY